MNFLWKVNEPLTANEMAERLAEDGWNNVTLFKTVQSLTTDGYLEVVGLEKTVKTYARNLCIFFFCLLIFCSDQSSCNVRNRTAVNSTLNQYIWIIRIY